VHKKFVLSYLFITLILLFSLSISNSSSEKLRTQSISLFSPLWEQILSTKAFVMHFFESKEKIENTRLKNKIDQLSIERQLLQLELEQFQTLIQKQKQLFLQLKNNNQIEDNKIQSLEKDFKKFLDRSMNQLHRQLQALPARVIFRSFDQWNSSLWINIGQKDNEKADQIIVAKNSPVLVDNAVVGIVDYVGAHQARVRLITDPSITPSVRAVRGGELENLVSDYITQISSFIHSEKSPKLDSTENQQLLSLLNNFKQTLNPFKKTWYLAKGELQGSLVPLGYAPPILKGIGFNYDFDDEEGPSRDLRTGKIQGKSDDSELPILKVNDILMTTGMDGIFPVGLRVAIVTKIHFLKEGDYFYELEAKPLASNLEDLSLVFVIPPLGEFEKFTP